MTAAYRYGQKHANFLYRVAPGVASAFDAVKTVGSAAGNAYDATGNALHMARMFPELVKAHYEANTPARPDPYPALHSTQPAMLAALQSAAFNGPQSYDQGTSVPMPHHRRHRRHHG